jgi:hypothetical protein
MPRSRIGSRPGAARRRSRHRSADEADLVARSRLLLTRPSPRRLRLLAAISPGEPLRERQRRHRDHDLQHRQRRERAETALLVHVVDHDREHLELRRIEQNRRRQFAGEGDEQQRPAGGDAGLEQRQGDAAEGREPARAGGERAFLELGMDLLVLGLRPRRRNLLRVGGDFLGQARQLPLDLPFLQTIPGAIRIVESLERCKVLREREGAEAHNDWHQPKPSLFITGE